MIFVQKNNLQEIVFYIQSKVILPEGVEEAEGKKKMGIKSIMGVQRALFQFALQSGVSESSVLKNVC